MDKGKIVLDGEPRAILSSQKARLLGVGVPKATRLHQILKEHGQLTRTVPVTSDEVVEMLREALQQ